MAQQHVHHLFPGSNTCRGFVGFFEELRRKADRTVILKGGPGVGKSTLMREAGRRFERQGMDVYYYHCSGDPDSLDGVLAPAAGYLVMDGTAPHTVDPAVPGARDGILNLGVCLNESQLASQAAEIESLQRRISACYAQAYRYLQSAHAIRDDVAAVYREALSDREKAMLIREWLAEVPSGPDGGEDHAFVQAITWKGMLQETDAMLTDRVHCLDVPWGFDAHVLLLPLWQAAAARGTARCAYHDPLDADCFAHVVIGSNVFTTAVMMDASVLTPQLDTSVLRREGQRLAFDRAVYDIMVNQAVEALAEAKNHHDSLERYYIDAMDYSRLEEIKQQFIERLPVDKCDGM